MLRTCESLTIHPSVIHLGLGSLDPFGLDLSLGCCGLDHKTLVAPTPDVPLSVCRLVEVSVPAASGLPQPGAAGWTDRGLCLLLP